MNRLLTELQRLYPLANDPAAPPGKVRALVLAVAAPGAWATLAAAWRGVQADLDLPAPAIAISGVDRIQLWFSLAEAVDTARGAAFLEGLRRRYLSGVAAGRVAMLAGSLPDFPPQQVAPERWSAFVAPDLAPLFDDEPWLDQPAGPDAQADLLSRLEPTPAREFDQALAQVAPPTAAATNETGRPATPAPLTQAPRAFLHQVMNDPSVDLALRIEAAKALLPHTTG